ncbi:protein kinase, partial [uncultured Aeromicrobium sp.]|uniref:protein kinase domain-containing protein n=1 Tax=uncultured Aeromicrobium sp. TaxID=337820 RepID=UPI0025FE7891
MTVTGDQALVGHTLDGRYVIHERIARGGMASVFRATDLRLDRVVAVKIMHAGLGDADDFRRRFVSEAKAAAKLNHRNVVAVFDQGTDGDFTYLVMEYVPGRTLRDVLRAQAPMSAQQALAYLDPILQALAEAHAAKLIHRDVKPENVLITPSGEVKVADFGLARAVSSSTAHTGGALIGTVSYLAPEVVLHRGSDPRADVYACGAMLFEMLTGRKPHVADTPIQIAYLHVNVDIPAPSTLVSGLPDYVDALVARATARDPQRRSPDARALLYQVRQVRRALAEGADDDPELTADLLPSTPRTNQDEPTQAVDVVPLGSAADPAPTA